MPFNPEVVRQVDSVLRHRSQIVQILVKHDLYQAPASEIDIHELRKHGDRYFIHSPLLGKMKSADGVYIFVIRSWEPWRIVCAKIGSVGGHTSLSREHRNGRQFVGSVHFAGEMIFERGHLIAWNNGSGHYRPESNLERTNVLPYINHMLPIGLFRSNGSAGRTFGYANG
ncbi:hypothetical protein N5D52_04765 [Pseudomonas sp. GD03860]|mgnify:CR=1 FL=1|uniref:hypothetical protein n=1 Tax=Pseudomonas TaxID=286 RepID=UPI002363508E|nr:MULTISPECIES: hypothetical protein [Pseudomonas]MDD2058307.1 hypothetical protein [Pseudomonas putida]MDH0636240.1 hypothetical protein [Pseudomonas sp. GD03860]